MKRSTILAGLGVLVVAATCVRLGFWQLSRWEEKRERNALARELLVRPPLLSSPAAAPSLEAARGRVLTLMGRYDETRQVLIAARSHRGAPGVEVVTPLQTQNGETRVLVNRGWIPAADAATARPQDCPEPTTHPVTGMAEEMRSGAGIGPIRSWRSDSVVLHSVRVLDAESLASRFPYPIAPYVLRELPDAGLPQMPVRSLPSPENEAMHLSYAIQWFLFAAIAVGGPLAVAMHRRANAAPPS